MLIPGISAELEQEIDPNYGLFDDATPVEYELDWCPPIVVELFKVSLPWHVFSFENVARPLRRVQFDSMTVATGKVANDPVFFSSWHRLRLL